MTVESTINRENYIAQSGDDSYDFPFKYFKSTDILVFVDGVNLTTGYMVTAHANGPSFGGTVSLTTPMVGGEKVVIKRKLPNTQETDYEENEDFPSQVAEDDYDRAAMRDQDQQEILDRCLKVGEASTITDTVVEDPAPASIGKALIIAEGDVPGTYKIVYSADNIADIVNAVKQDALDAAASANLAEQNADRSEVAVGALFQRANPPFTLVSGQSDYTLTYPVNPIERNAAVFISGIFQENIDTNYIFPDENTIRFIGSIPVGSTAQVLTSLSASNPDLTQAVQDTIDFQDASLVRDNVSKTLAALYTVAWQSHTGTALTGIVLESNYVRWPLTGPSMFDELSFPAGVPLLFHIVPNGQTLTFASAYKTGGEEFDPTADVVKVMLDYDGTDKTILVANIRTI
jgi:hypothetical protein